MTDEEIQETPVYQSLWSAYLMWKQQAEASQEQQQVSLYRAQAVCSRALH